MPPAWMPMVADKISPLLLAGLTKAAADPWGKPLVGTKALPGLFPATAPGRQAAQKALAEGLLQVQTFTDTPRDRASATPLGLRYLAEHADPKPVLEDLVRVLEEREIQVQTLTATAKAMGESITGLKATVAAVLSSRATVEDTLPGAVLARLTDWAATAPAGQDCPLPELFRSLTVADDITPGRFHDCLRALHQQRRVYLHPWTGPLYALPEPTLALLVGHEVSYYASRRAA